MSVIERGVKTPKLDTFVRIANALGVSTDALLQDVVVPANESILAELSVRIGRLPQKDQERILNAIRALTE
jgi:transcriptional regulator with XRE-family HTH domain